jgi:hypothetical protein
MGVVAKEHGGGGFRETNHVETKVRQDGVKINRIEEDQPGTVFKTSQKRKGLSWE